MDQQESQQPLKGAFSINEFCQWAGIGRTATYAEIKAGRLPAKKLAQFALSKDEATRGWQKRALRQD